MRQGSERWIWKVPNSESGSRVSHLNDSAVRELLALTGMPLFTHQDTQPPKGVEVGCKGRIKVGTESKVLVKARRFRVLIDKPREEPRKKSS